MSNFNPDNLDDEKIEKFLNFWKDYFSLQQRVPKIYKGAHLLLEWMANCIEYKLKKSTIIELEKNKKKVFIFCFY